MSPEFRRKVVLEDITVKVYEVCTTLRLDNYRVRLQKQRVGSWSTSMLSSPKDQEESIEEL